MWINQAFRAYVVMVIVSSILTLQQIMKFTYTHITKKTVEKTIYIINKNNKIIKKIICTKQ